jgi:hypothetical protein
MSYYEDICGFYTTKVFNLMKLDQRVKLEEFTKDVSGGTDTVLLNLLDQNMTSIKDKLDNIGSFLLGFDKTTEVGKSIELLEKQKHTFFHLRIRDYFYRASINKVIDSFESILKKGNNLTDEERVRGKLILLWFYFSGFFLTCVKSMLYDSVSFERVGHMLFATGGNLTVFGDLTDTVLNDKFVYSVDKVDQVNTLCRIILKATFIQ